MKTGIIASIGVVGAGATAGGAYLITRNNSLSIEQLISKSINKIPVTKDSDWTTLWNAYKQENSGKGVGEDSWKLAEWKDSNNPTNIPNSYKTKCSSLLKEKVSDDKDPKYLEFLKMCSRNKTMGDLLKGSTLLGTETGNKDKWKAKFRNYQQGKKNDGSYPIDGITLAEGDKDTDDNHLKKLQDGCNSEWNKTVTGNETNAYLESLKKWCSAEVILN
ncbi:hypothetical protein MHC_01825 [Mycoplasma haemocanis str. Illinois]|uniref:Uncharacterized protein n=1 Tax=Mycoplasma haemocanis (strain Illinois) TaxID=1111676 RepID=H6N6F9_MYCHN|nr:hypothetical protein [Mycoplasma haemocanis]AEW45231.1 hypothetical protein MHC_01825 [Mycoplasma haemocanis str. Illinois]